MSKVSINESTLTNIGAAIREKTGKTDLIAPGDMPAEILAIVSGGGDIEVEPIVLTGDCVYGCASSIPSTYIRLFGDTVTTNNITNAEYMFKDYSLETIPFELNFKSGNNSNVNALFYNCKNLKQIPKINNLKIHYSCSSMFLGCESLEEIPEDIADDWDFSYFATNNYQQNGQLFQSCTKLKKAPMKLLNKFAQYWKSTSPYSCMYGSCFVYCESLREVLGMPVLNMAYASNAFSSIISWTHHLQRFTFATNEDGTPKTTSWKFQTLDFTNGIGFGSTSNHYESWNLINSDEEYEMYKDDLENYHAQKPEYSLYNHTAAVETINSLPDCSVSGGNNTIKFRGILGANTDGGAINTLTEEEIAVAAAKGWTVTLT